MAKQTLDLFKLFKLVVEKGGLVEVRGEKLLQNILCPWAHWGTKYFMIFLLFFLSGYKQENLARDH